MQRSAHQVVAWCASRCIQPSVTKSQTLGVYNMRHFSNATATRAMSMDDMRRLAPSIFATDKHDSRSERYTYIPTASVLEGLMKEGFNPVAVRQSRTRDS